METIIELINRRAAELKDGVGTLLREHSSLKRWNYPGTGIITLSGDYRWEPLSDDGIKLQSRLLEEYSRFVALITALAREQPKQISKDIEGADETLRGTIEQGSATHASSPDEARTRAEAALDLLAGVVTRLDGAADGLTMLVPDTNALLHNPWLEDWDFESMNRFQFVLTPAVLGELDRLKINHRNERVRSKAEGLIRRIKEYRRRGRLTDGVPIVSGRSEIVALAVEPRVGMTLPWLDAGNADDRIIATVIEVMRQNPGSAVVIVTRDINLQNKAEFANLPSLEPPDPTRPDT